MRRHHSSTDLHLLQSPSRFEQVAHVNELKAYHMHQWQPFFCAEIPFCLRCGQLVTVLFCNTTLHQAGPRCVEKVTGLNNKVVGLHFENYSLISGTL